MKPRNREINIFNLSMMDVIAGALGAVLIIVIILFPHYQKDLAEENQKLREKVQAAENARRQAEEARRQAEEAKKQTENQLQEAQEILKDCKEKLAKTFLVVVIKWKTRLQDIDLHIVDPGGAEFYYRRKTVPGRPGELSEDDQIGPGNEVWEIRDAPPGDYRIYYNLYSRHGNSENPVVMGRIFFRDGSKKIPDTQLTREKEKKLAAKITVKENGNVEIR